MIGFQILELHVRLWIFEFGLQAWKCLPRGAGLRAGSGLTSLSPQSGHGALCSDLRPKRQ